MFKYFVFILYFGSLNCFSQNASEVNVAVKSYRKMLPSSFSIASQYEVQKVLKVDLDYDGTADRVIIWQNLKKIEGDTLFTSIYLYKDTSYVFFKTLNNLFSPDFSYWSSTSTGNVVLDSLKEMYIDSNYDKVKFTQGTIKIGFSLSSFDGYDYYFVYNKVKRTWVLDRTQYWKGWNYLEREKSEIKKVSKGMTIDQFNILKEIGYH